MAEEMLNISIRRTPESDQFTAPFAVHAKAWGFACKAAVLMFAVTILMLCGTAHAQDLECSLGKVTERVPPRYPVQLGGRVVEGDVNVLATFAPDGRVSSSKVINGPQPLQFEARAYLSGWRAEPASAPRQCIIHLKYRFDGSQGVCTKNREVDVRPERLSETDVLLHLSCDAF